MKHCRFLLQHLKKIFFNSQNMFYKCVVMIRCRLLLQYLKFCLNSQNIFYKCAVPVKNSGVLGLKRQCSPNQIRSQGPVPVALKRLDCPGYRDTYWC